MLTVPTLIELYKTLAENQVDLAKYLSCVPEVGARGQQVAELNTRKISIGDRFLAFGSFVATKATTTGTQTEYIHLLLQTIQATRFLLPWLKLSIKSMGVAQDASKTEPLLLLIATFLEQTLCGMALADLNQLQKEKLAMESANFCHNNA